MKKLFFTLCALCLCGTMWALDDDDTNRPTDASLIYQDEATGLYFYIDTDGTKTTVGGAVITYEVLSSNENYVNHDFSNFSIPQTVQASGGSEYSVTAVGGFAFAQTSLSGAIVIPEYINLLGVKAFFQCTGITSVTIDYSETALTEDNQELFGCSFYGCSGLTTVTLNRILSLHRGSSSVYRVSPFSDLPSITTVYIGEHVNSLPNNAFNSNSSAGLLSNVYCYATNPPTLATDVFANRASSCTLHVYDALVSDYEGSDWNTYFTSILGDLENPEIEEGTYKDVTTGLYFELDEDGNASIYHDELGTYTDDNLVPHATITGAYTLPAQVSADGVTYYDVTRVEASAFANSSISGHLVIPSYINALGINAFANCTGITEVTFEYSETALQDESNTNNLGTETFLGCTKVETVNLYRDIDLSLTKSICGPFCTTYAIHTLNIGPRVTELGDYMFHYAFSTSTTPVINCYVPTPFQLGYYSFDTGGNYSFYVPNGAATAYSTLEAASSNHTAWNQSGSFTDMSDAFAITTNEGEDGAYATFYNGASAVEFFNAEATVYAATSVKIEDGDGNVYIESLGSVVPKATAVLVETSEAQTMLAIATTEEATAPTTNYLYGYDTATEITTPADCVYYMLTYGTDSSLGFYWGAENGGAFNSAAHKAYLAIPSGIANNTSGISIKKDADGDTTGISSVEVENEANTVKGIYTLQGVRVSDMNQKGVYIVDGKKVLVK